MYKTTIKICQNKKPVSIVLFVINKHDSNELNFLYSIMCNRHKYNKPARLFYIVCKHTKAEKQRCFLT